MKPIKDWDDADIVAFRVRADGWIRKMVLGTWALCSAMILGAWLFQLLW